MGSGEVRRGSGGGRKSFPYHEAYILRPTNATTIDTQAGPYCSKTPIQRGNAVRPEHTTDEFPRFIKDSKFKEGRLSRRRRVAVSSFGFFLRSRNAWTAAAEPTYPRPRKPVHAVASRVSSQTCSQSSTACPIFRL